MDSCRIQPETNEHMCEFAHSLAFAGTVALRECKSGIVALDFPKNSNENARDFIFLWRAFTFVVRRLLCCSDVQ